MYNRLAFSVIIFLLIGISCSQKNNNTDCTRFRNGAFFYKERINGIIVNVQRDDSVQIETDESKSFVHTIKVVWTSPCKYETMFVSRVPLYLREVTDEERSLIDSFRKTPLETKIIATGTDYYVFESTKKGTPVYLKDTMWVKK